MTASADLARALGTNGSASPRRTRAGDARAVTLRRALPLDQAAIVELVLGERLNPNQIDWRRFVVASIGGELVGAAQMRLHADGSRELGSLVVAPRHRGQGIAQHLIAQLLGEQSGDVHVVTPRSNAVHYERWGFRAVAAHRAPRGVLRNYLLGQVCGSLVALLTGRWPRRLVILERG